ncbi:TPA: terminase small subunit protein [Stenotrophomonas maltophilia]|uniref:terminase small subunit-like protein n=1 Tax=Stenotrophomonas TaxID=40323 RepID=UPI000B515B37|nr:terminase small subunit protein [Stenotrophomonas maltophilia]ASE54783.1 terminase small subunit protein [Stenotrophomonas maltophilia]MBH1458090.1 terminase small subunit protein [Stenotrophomonas maltophilia]MBH1597471.1 terminase small subunit protein [Stenotrophomonas maltophilia]MBH1699219.1 terminase small subunit protein [Stenotrophomonas maltophilia]MBH1711963.1 terminase small subunit protein [Stenotrophomonas maltophilia]
MARPSKYSQQLADAICDLLVDGKSLRTICSTAKMPSRSTVIRWLADNETFRNQYARARELQADTLAEEILDIADKAVLGERLKKDGKGKVLERQTGDMVERSKLMIDARKWYAGKLQPKKYGERVALDHGVQDNLADKLRAARERAAGRES